MKHKATYFFTILLAVLWISSCGVRRNNFISRSFHNTTSLFNYHYNAKIKVKEGVDKINAAYRVPPEGFIPVWFAGTDADAKANSTTFDNAIEICEIALQKHNQKDNKWFDNFRFIIGKAWFYKRSYILAINNFEWVIKTYPDSKLLPQVYMWLVKTYYMDDNPSQATKILEENLKRAELSKRQLGELSLITAQLQLDQGQYDEVLRTLNANRKYIKGANNKARVSYLLGQIYQSQDQFTKAYDNYEAVTKINTDYELIFNAKLNMAKLLIAGDGSVADAGKLMRLLKKMLRDEKNIDYKDRIYYEMAMLDYKGKDLKGAIAYLQQSIANNTNNQRQKALSYYKVGQIYFYDMKDFTHAQAYFDSASAAINKDAPEYREISTISATLKEYVGFIGTIETQDSLLQLSKLSDKALEAYVDEYLEDEAKRKQAEEEKQLEELKLANNPNNLNQFGESEKRGGSGFYFDSPDQVNSGKVKFEQLWGNRRNEDNWRRKNKTAIAMGDDPEEVKVAISEDEIKKYGSAEKARMIKNVPRTEDDKAVANQKVVEAMYGLAQVYHNKLKILDSATAVYTRLVARFPDTEFTLKSRYALYSIYKEGSQDDLAGEQKRKICSEAPNSRYCKYCNNEVFVDESKQSMESFAGAYRALLETYKNKDWNTCIDFTNFIIEMFPQDEGLAEVYMIRGKSFGSMGQKDSLISNYTYARTNFPDADVIPEVNRTLALLSGGPTEVPSSGGGKPKGPTNDPRFAGFEPDRKPHEKVYVVMMIKSERVQTNALQQKINDFNGKYHPEKRLNVSVFLYQNKYHLPYISQFDSESDALGYASAIHDDPTMADLFGDPSEGCVFISPNNFRTAYGKKRMEDYFEYYKTVLLPGVK